MLFGTVKELEMQERVLRLLGKAGPVGFCLRDLQSRNVPWCLPGEQWRLLLPWLLEAWTAHNISAELVQKHLGSWRFCRGC